MADPGKKRPNIWAVTAITYGTVIAVTLLSIAAYYYIGPRHAESRLSEATRSMAVGSVWIAVYPGAQISSTDSEKRDKETESRLTFETKDGAEEVLSFYQAALKKGVFRFSIVKRNANGGTVRSLAHEGKTTVLVTIQTTGGGTHGEIRTIDTDTKK